MRHYLLYKFESSAHTHAAFLTNEIKGLFQYGSGGAYPLSQPNQGISPKSEGGIWARD